jgi:hypothetical protein
LETKGKYGRRKNNKDGKVENSVGRNNGEFLPRVK